MSSAPCMLSLFYPFWHVLSPPGAPRTSAAPGVRRLGGSGPDALARTPGRTGYCQSVYAILSINNMYL